MAELERTEGDFAYYSDGSVRWAEGNSQGKHKGSLAKRHPKADDGLRLSLAKRGTVNGKNLADLPKMAALAEIGREKETVRKQQAQAEAEAGLLRAGMSLSPLSPKLPAEAWGFIL